MRTSDKMESQYELILSLNYRGIFDLDFQSAYSIQTYESLTNPCYRIDKESETGQDWLLGRDLLMYGSHEDFHLKKILD